MANKEKNIDEHVDVHLSGYIDGELTQQERQRVEIHCEDCADCRQLLDQLSELRGQVGNAQLTKYGEDKWREMMDDTTVKTSRAVGWLLLIGGVLAISGIAIYEFVSDPGEAWHVKLIVAAIYGGFTALFISVLRQRLIERKSDKYKDVEI